MKAKVKAGEEPWISGWRVWLSSPVASLDFEPKPFAHVVRGAYDIPDRGGKEIQESADAAENHVIQWYITENEAHARKAVEILDAWSGTLADFSRNDAMLLAGWTGGQFCNAAEILRASYPGWSRKSQDQFKRMMLTVYVPLLRMYYPEANGNWDAAIMHTLLATGIFCEDRELMNSVYDHFRLGPLNSGITHYVYPSGQCEESCRDQGHTQLGLSFMSKTCVIAWNQGVDLFGEADNRLALGVEYTARYNLGDSVPAYGKISDRSRGRFGDFYNEVLQHYRYVKHIEMPYTEKAAARVLRSHTVLTRFRGAMGQNLAKLNPPPAASTVAATAGAQPRPMVAVSAEAMKISPGESIQNALDILKAKGGGALKLMAGVHTLPETLKMPSGVTIMGTGLDCVLILAAKGRGDAAIMNAEPDMHDVALQDMVIDGAKTTEAGEDPNSGVQRRRLEYGPIRAGIVFRNDGKDRMRNVRLEHITVHNCTSSAVDLFGVDQVEIIDCDISASGGMVPPGHGKNHNLKMNRISRVSIHGSRFADSMWGHGVAVIFGRDVSLRNCELARNALDGVMVAESHDVRVEDCLAEGNGGAGISRSTWMDPDRGVVLESNVLRNNVEVS